MLHAWTSTRSALSQSMARMSSATSTKKADPTGPLRRSRPNRTPGCRRRAGMLSRRLYDGVGESLDHRGARTLLVVKPESPRELSSALTGRLEINTATTIRHSQPAELDLVEQGDEPRARFTNSSMRGSRILMKLRV